jgi:hypothetical protein
MKMGPKLKKRGFVMTGGGAKGFYEAGVIHAFHITGMEFDVITGSSIGAMNSIFFAEYLYQKHLLPEAVRQNPFQAIQALDERVRAFHHAWLLMPDKRIVDDSAEGPLGKIKDDLAGFNIDLPLMAQLAWWWTDPDRQAAPPAGAWPGLLRLGAELIGRLGGVNELLRLLKFYRANATQEALRVYLARFGIDHALIPAADDHRLKDIFTQPVSPLRAEHLAGNEAAPDDPAAPQYILVDPQRTLGDFARQDIAVRVTRANYRTGRLEISTYVPLENFVRFMEKQAWRLEVSDTEMIPLGSFRLQVPGNPNAVNAGLCSGRFPGVFSPFPLENIYSAADPENQVLNSMLTNWLDDPAVTDALKASFQAIHNDPKDSRQPDALLASWKNSTSMRDFFPRAGDTYVDGGSIDNTPSNSAVDFIREWAERSGMSKRALKLELFVIFLDTEPKVDPDRVKDPAIFQVVNRTLQIQGAAKRSSDTNTVGTINSFGQRSEDLAQALQTVLESFEQTLAGMDPAQKSAFEQQIYAKIQEMGLRGFLGAAPEGILERMRQWVDTQLARGLPVQIDTVNIYPEQMPLGTLQFTERLGYHKENAIQMLCMGCYNTLWALRNHLENERAELDERDRQVLALAQKWMGMEAWPANADELDKARQSWRCQRTECVYHAKYCAHGANL